VANDFYGCFQASLSSNILVYGNETTNVGIARATKQQHAVYLSTDTNHVDFGWNSIHDNRSCRALQAHSSPVGSGTGNNQYDLSIHDNLIYNDPCDGIELATVDPSKGKVEIYNNLIYQVGTGPSPGDGDGSYSCVRVYGLTNAGSAGGGTVEVYNNTFYDCGSFEGPWGQNGVFDVDGVNKNLVLRARNNLIIQLAEENWVNGGSTAPNGVLIGSDNLWWGSSQPLPTQTTNNVLETPLVVNVSNQDFHLQPGSPAIDSGEAIASSNAYGNYPVWNGTPTDRCGNVRPRGSAYDIGAYEYTTASQPPSPPSNLNATAQ
jgi:hypothetical protein